MKETLTEMVSRREKVSKLLNKEKPMEKTSENVAMQIILICGEKGKNKENLKKVKQAGLIEQSPLEKARKMWEEWKTPSMTRINMQTLVDYYELAIKDLQNK